MKSAFELAMERLGGELKEYSPEQKEQLSEIDRVYDAKVAQARLNAQERLRNAGHDQTAREQIADDLAVEVASHEEKREREKQKVRDA